MPDICLLYACGQHHVQYDAGNQVGKVCGRQRQKSERCSKRSKRNDCYDANANKGEHRKRGGSAALDERELRCPDHVNNQGLAPHGFDKPSGLEQRHIIRLHL